MPMPPVHVAVGMVVSSALGVVALVRRRRWLIYVPLVMSLCGLLALVPDVVARRGASVPGADFGGYAHRQHSHGPLMNVFFFHPWLDRVPWLETQEMTALGFQVVALLSLAALTGYAAFIRWGLPRMADSGEALARIRARTAAYRPLAAAAGIVPLLLIGAAVGWLTRTAQVPQPSARQLARREHVQWSSLVRRRMRVSPGHYLGLVRATTWKGGQWLEGDLGAHTVFSGGAVDPEGVVEHAQANRCHFVVLADADGPATPEQMARYAEALRAVRAKFRDMAILGGLSWQGPETGGHRGAAVLVAPQAVEMALLAGFHQRFNRGAAPRSPEAALRWLKAHNHAHAASPVVLSWPAPGDGAPEADLFSWLRTNEVFLGIVGLSGGERDKGEGRWDPRVATVGGAWDRLLDRGFRVWSAAAASGFRDPARHYWPGEQVRTHVWCRGRRPGHVLEGLRAGCFWAAEGGVVTDLVFEVTAPLADRPARMGEVVRVAPEAPVGVELTLDVPATDAEGDPIPLDQVELISNFRGEPEVIERFEGVQTQQLLRHTFLRAADHNGGVGFYVRARGYRELEDGSRRWFYTNPIRVLVRGGLERPEADIRVARPPEPKPKDGKQPEPPDHKQPKPPDHKQPEPPTKPNTFAAIGLPSELVAVHIEGFGKKPGQGWAGEWTSNAEQRGPAMAGDDRLHIVFNEGFRMGEATRLFFRAHARECGRLTLLLHTSRSQMLYQRVYELPEARWAAFDLSLRDEFHPPRGAPSRLSPGDRVKAIEWRAEPLSHNATFFLTDFAAYERTLSARVALARRRAGEPREVGPARGQGELERAIIEAAALSKPSRAWQARADTLAQRVADCAKQLQQEPTARPLAWIGAIEHELDAVEGEIRRLARQATMARLFAVSDPPYVVGLAPATRRVSARSPALALGGELMRSIELRAAAGEAESFQLVVHALWQPLRAVDVTWTDLRPEDGEGPSLPASALSAAVATELWAYPRADLPRERTGWTPDPLVPFLPFDVEPDDLRCVVVTVQVPADLPPADYVGTVRVEPMGLPSVAVTVRLRRWDFALTDCHFPVVGPIDGRALREQYPDGDGGPEPSRRQLYELLLRHGVQPVVLLGRDDEANLADLTFCLERGLGLGVLHEVASIDRMGRDPGVERAGRYASQLREAGWGARGAVLLPLSRGQLTAEQFVRTLSSMSRRLPDVAWIAGGESGPPGGLAADYWRRPLGVERLRRPAAEIVAVRRARSTRLAAWELGPAAGDYPDANLTLTNLLVESRVLPWLAWRHGVRALVLQGVNRWRENNRGAGLLVYPGPSGELYGSLRLVALRDGVEDYGYLWLLWDRARRLRERAPQRHMGVLSAAEQMMAEVDRRIGTVERPSRDLQALAALRERLGRVVERLEAAWWREVDGAEDLPKPPPRLTARAGDARVTLSWPQSPDEEVGAYHVFRSCDPKAGFVRVNPAPVKALTYEDAAVRNDVTYHYVVRSVSEEGAVGPRSQIARAKPQPAPEVVWLPMADLTIASKGPYRVALRLKGPGTGGLLPLVRPQVDYCLSDGFYDGFEEMVRRDDGSWTFGVPDLDWGANAAKTLRIQVRIVDRRNRVVAPAVEREERIDTAEAPTK